MDEDAKLLELFEQFSDLINNSELTNAALRAVLCKTLVLLAMQSIDKEELMLQLDYSWRFEKFFQPDSTEIH
jgi:hypothetical protein